MTYGAIILCGGKSTRMGSDKALLPFGPEAMLQRMVRLIRQTIAADQIVVVAAENQKLPPLADTINVIRDQRPDRGPLEGLAAGLQVIDPRIDAVYVTSCDVPLLVAPFVRTMFEFLGDYDIAVPKDDNHYHPLAAVYRTSVLTAIQQLLNANTLSLRGLFQLVNTRVVPVEELRSVDPDLSTLMNLNRLEDYRAALVAAGLHQET